MIDLGLDFLEILSCVGLERACGGVRRGMGDLCFSFGNSRCCEIRLHYIEVLIYSFS